MKLLGIILILISAFVGHRLYSGNSSIHPLPYEFPRNVKLLSPTELQKAEKAPVVIVGDENGQYFDRYEKEFRRSLDPLLATVPIFNMSETNHGLHRNLKKLNELRKHPKIVIYMGNTSERFEQKFTMKAYPSFKANLQKYENDRFHSIMLLIPAASSFIYSPMPIKTLTREIKEDKPLTSAKLQQLSLDFSFKIYEMEVQQLIDYSYENEVKLILFTTPINLENIPNKVCRNSTSEQLEKKLTQLAQNLLKGDFKTAHNDLLALKEKVLGNARFFYLLGRTYYNLGNYEKSKEYFLKANAFDCYPSGPQHILNNIIRQKAKQNDISLFDFDKEIQRSFGTNVLFKNDLRPQDLFYEKMLSELAKTVSKYLKSN